MSNDIIYLDYNATTYIHEKVAKAMEPYLSTLFGNPSSSHIFGTQTKQAVQKSREQISKMLNCSSSEIIFTSGGSESNNYAIKGIVYYYIHNNINSNEKFDIITSQIEHPSVLEVFKFLEKTFKDKLNVIYLSVDKEGIINMEEFKEKLTPKCIFISIMHANNETGSIQPIKEITLYSKKINPNIIIHTDASQSIGKIKVDVKEMQIDLLTVCSHKFYGPKGIGCLYIKNGVENKLEKIIHGANHEHNMRAGTENVLEIVGLGEASNLVFEELNNRILHFKKTRNIIYKILSENTNCILHGPPINLNDDLNNIEKRLSNTLYISFPNISANLILDMLSNKIACSAGAACHSDEVTMSYVLNAMKVTPEVAMGTLRISTGINTTEKNCEDAANFIVNVINELSNKNNNNLNNNINDGDICRLTKNTHGMGCGCKISPKILNNLLNSLPKMKSIENNKNNILVSNDTCDDACVYNIENNENNNENNNKIDKGALITTLDFLTPICDKPYDYGQIATANAISDIYAMGGKPINALTIVAFPISRLPINVLKEILIGAFDKADEANCPILGGHSIEDNEPKFGLSVNGLCNKNFIWKNSTIEENDIIILTKEIGVGIIMTGVKKDFVNENDKCVIKAIETMKQLNKYHAECLINLEEKYGKIVNAATDITGFGLIGHLIECIGNKNLCAEINFNKIKFIERTKEFVEMDIIPGGANNNFGFSKGKVDYGNIDKNEQILINDPQTSGGLLIFVAKDKRDLVKKSFEEKKLSYFEIGTITKRKDNKKDILVFVNKE
jgi:selenium donor protein